MPWGRIVFNPATSITDPADFCLVFHQEAHAKRAAFELAKVMHDEIAARLAAEQIDGIVEFIAADDHFHLVVADRAAVLARAANGISRAATNLARAVSHGAMTGGEAPGRSITTITGRHRAVHVSESGEP